MVRDVCTRNRCKWSQFPRFDKTERRARVCVRACALGRCVLYLYGMVYVIVPGHATQPPPPPLAVALERCCGNGVRDACNTDKIMRAKREHCVDSSFNISESISSGIRPPPRPPPPGSGRVRARAHAHDAVSSLLSSPPRHRYICALRHGRFTRNSETICLRKYAYYRLHARQHARACS